METVAARFVELWKATVAERDVGALESLLTEDAS